eukprot:TRINITY_DN13920_c0_g2_i1.p1 TRINITY_DN13920_c0_g2~~TRINITY_DN13920_c0_g2_i1.p1  ORF type:complete len:160 (-),score=62.21 TRINITY_DN13920_c0_g2_i1:473-952(-)
MLRSLVGSEMCIRDSTAAASSNQTTATLDLQPVAEQLRERVSEAEGELASSKRLLEQTRQVLDQKNAELHDAQARSEHLRALSKQAERLAILSKVETLRARKEYKAEQDRLETARQAAERADFVARTAKVEAKHAAGEAAAVALENEPSEEPSSEDAPN